MYIYVFKNFNLYIFCLEAIRSIKRYSEVPNIDIEKPLKNWMAQASQREKIKKLKMNNTN